MQPQEMTAHQHPPQKTTYCHFYTSRFVQLKQVTYMLILCLYVDIVTFRQSRGSFFSLSSIYLK